MGVRIEADPESGVIDFFMCPAHPPFAKCMLRGTLPSFGQAAAPSGDFVELAAGYWHTCALRPDNSIACCGPGQPGDAASNANYGQSTVPPLP
jgi:hypothetical protein